MYLVDLLARKTIILLTWPGRFDCQLNNQISKQHIQNIFHIPLNK